MIKYEDYRSDKNFNIDTLPYEEIFDGFKDVINEIKKRDNIDGFKFWPVELRKDRCECQMAYGADKDLYPKIKLDMYEYLLIVTTFEVKLLVFDNGLKEIKSEDLDNALIKFMCNRFPNSDYLAKREKYFEDAETMKLF